MVYLHTFIRFSLFESVSLARLKRDTRMHLLKHNACSENNLHFTSRERQCLQTKKFSENDTITRTTLGNMPTYEKVVRIIVDICSTHRWQEIVSERKVWLPFRRGKRSRTKDAFLNADITVLSKILGVLHSLPCQRKSEELSGSCLEVDAGS